jgi:hypothetical protein
VFVGLPGKWEKTLIEYKILVCPNLECGNIDTELMYIYSTDLDTSKWYGDALEDPLTDKTPVFQYGKSVYTEGSDEPDDAECQVCGQMWEVSPATHYYDFG